RYDLAVDLENSAKIIEKSDAEFGNHGGLVEKYRLDDADYAVVMMGGWCGDAKDAIDVLRGEGYKIGLLRLRFLRPFPKKAVKELSGEVLVVDKGNSDIRGVLGIEVSSCGIEAKNVVAGIGGVDVGVEDFCRIFKNFVEGRIELEWYL
ncbi:MAG: pyruvate ferredoxin oxidoreductase, partial [Archaeoglobi archaeon]